MTSQNLWLYHSAFYCKTLQYATIFQWFEYKHCCLDLKNCNGDLLFWWMIPFYERQLSEKIVKPKRIDR